MRLHRLHVIEANAAIDALTLDIRFEAAFRGREGVQVRTTVFRGAREYVEPGSSYVGVR